jgi:hypothetical protein
MNAEKKIIEYKTMSGPITPSPLGICDADEQRMSLITTPVVEGVDTPFQVSSSCNQRMPPLQLQRRNCFHATKKTKPAANPSLPVSNRLCSITFDEVVRVRMVACSKSVTRVYRLWYQDSDYERFRARITKLATLAKPCDILRISIRAT